MDSSRHIRGIMSRTVGRTTHQEETDMDATTIAIDLAKDVFEIAIAQRRGRDVEHRRLSRRQFTSFVDSLPSDVTVVMEACGTSHYWGRRCAARAAHVRLLPTQYVRPYARRNKTDRADADALLETHRCGGIHPVPVKTIEQQGRAESSSRAGAVAGDPDRPHQHHSGDPARAGCTASSRCRDRPPSGVGTAGR
jgi:hypothetical protein